MLVSLIGRATFGRPIYGLSAANAEGNAFGIAEQLFTKYVFAFEVVSALLITAALGAMVLGHSQKSKSKFAQRDLSIARFRKDNLNAAAGLPAAGVMHYIMQWMFQRFYQLEKQHRLQFLMYYRHEAT